MSARTFAADEVGVTAMSESSAYTVTVKECELPEVGHGGAYIGLPELLMARNVPFGRDPSPMDVVLGSRLTAAQ